MKKRDRILTYLCLTGVIGLTVLAMVTSRFGWSLYLEVFSHFQAQYFLALLLVTALAPLFKNYRLLLVMVFCSAMVSVQILPWYIPTHLGTPAANYRVLLANLNFSNTDAGRTLALVATEQPDLAVFLETGVDIEQQLTAIKTSLPYTKDITVDHGILMYSKYPLDDVKVELFGDYVRESLTANLTINGSPISLIAAHPWPPIKAKMFSSRNLLLKKVGQYINNQPNPVIFLGDLNITMWSPYYQQLVQQTHLKNARQGFGIRPTWPRAVSYYGLPDWVQWLITPLQIPIDHCLVSPQIQVSNIHTGADTGSDHAPLVVDLVVPGARG